MGERDRPDLTPYRASADVVADTERAPRYVPLTRKQHRLRRWAWALPIGAFALLAFALERPWLLAAGLAWGVGVAISDRLHGRALNGRLKALARTLARDGDPFVASRGLEAVVADARTYPGFHSVALLFLGIARARGGDAEGALDLFYVVHDAGWLENRPGWMAWLLPWMATMHAVRGELDRAEGWLAVARARLPADKRESLVACEALVALRRGRPEDAIGRIDAYRTAHPAKGEEAVRAHFAVLRAFACEQAGRPLPAGDVQALVAARMTAPGRALPLECWWGEFAAFLERNAPRSGTRAAG